MKPVPENILHKFQKLFPYIEAELHPYRLGEEGSDGAIYRFGNRDVLLKICRLNKVDFRREGLRFERRLKFLSFLFERGVPVIEPIASASGNYFEIVDEENDCWVGYAMKYIQGKTPSPEDWNPEFVELWGGAIGKLHHATQEYPHWKKTIDLETGKELLGWESEWEFFSQLNAEPEIQEAWQRIHDELNAFPVLRDCFGLIHNDPHLWNMRWDGQNAILLDFEVANHHWFVNDIAIACQHVLFMLSGGLSHPLHHPERLADFLKVFLKGYHQENQLPDEWQSQLEPFFAYRRILLYTVMVGWRSSDPELQTSWKKMILTRPFLLRDISL